jgi:hypothetical protein
MENSLGTQGVRRGHFFWFRASRPGGKRTQQDCYFAVMVQSPSDLIWTKPGVSWTVPV